MSPREEYPEPVVVAVPARATGLLHWVALLLAPAAGPAWWHYRLPGPWWVPSAVMLAVALLGRATRRLLWRLLWVWPPGRACLAALAAAAVGWWLWGSGGFYGRVTVCVLPPLCGAVFLAPRLRRDPTTDSDMPALDRGWAGRVEGDWHAIASAAGLHHPGNPGLVAPLLQPPTEPDRAALELRLDLTPAALLPEDVRSAAPVLRRRLRAPHIRVRAGSDDGADVAIVRAYRRHPMAVPVGWRDVRPLDDPSGEWVPVGVDEWGRPAGVRWRIPLLIAGAQESGKTVLIRAGVRGLVQAQVPARLWVWDNRADFRDLRPIAHEFADGFADGLELVRGLVRELDERVASTGPAVDEDAGYEWTPTLAEPAEILVVGELLTALEGPPGRDKSAGEIRAAVPPLLRRIARDGRAMAIGFWATAQTTIKEGPLDQLRDLMPQKAACRLESEHLIEPALGSGAKQATARPDLIPASLQGVTVLVDPVTRAQTYIRSGWIPSRDTRAALIDPYRRLMGRHLTVIEGEAAN